MTNEQPRRSVWVVVRGSWYYNDEFDVGGESSIMAFTSRAKAEAYVRAWEEYHTTPQGRYELACGQGTASYQIVEMDLQEAEGGPEAVTAALS
jgi:hypothetical protein